MGELVKKEGSVKDMVEDLQKEGINVSVCESKTLTNYEADFLYSSLVELSNSDIKFSIETGFRLLQNIKTIERELEPYRIGIQKIISQYSQDGKTVSKKDNPEKYEECIQKLNNLGNIKIKCELNFINTSELAGLKIPIKQIKALLLISLGEDGNNGN